MSTTQTDSISLDDLPLNAFHIRLAALTLGAHFTDGYSIGTISFALASMSRYTELSPLWQGLLGSSALIGLFLGSLITGWLSDKVGRKTIFLFSFVLIGAASLLQYFVTTPLELFLLRIFIGFGIGGDYSVGVALLTEFTPKKERGVLVGSLSAVWTVGYVAAALLGYFLSDILSWRILLASAVIPSSIVLLMRRGIPESPRWLIRMGRQHEARAILDKHFGTEVYIEENEVHGLGYKMLFTKKYRRMTWFSALYFAFSVIPYFAIYTFLPSILKAFSLSEGVGSDLLLQGMLLIGAGIGIWLTICLSRKQFSVSAFALCSLALFVLCFVPAEPGFALVILAAFSLFTLSISAAGNLTAVFPAECLPTEVRSSGIGFATAVSRLSSALGTFLLPLVMHHTSIQSALLVLAFICVTGTVMCYAWAPHSHNISLARASSGKQPHATR